MEKVIERIPTWALCYIINDDATGLSEEDIAQVQEFFSVLREDWLPHSNCIAYCR